MLYSKYLKKSLHYDLIYRIDIKNPLNFPLIKRSSFLFSGTSSLFKILYSANLIKILSCSPFSKIKISLSSISINERSIRKGDPLSCSMILGKTSTAFFLDSYMSVLSSISTILPLTVNSRLSVVSFPLLNVHSFFPYVFYRSCLSTFSQQNFEIPTLSLYFSQHLSSGSSCLLSVFFPIYVHKKNVNSFRTILREIEQSG